MVIIQLLISTKKDTIDEMTTYSFLSNSLQNKEKKRIKILTIFH